MGMNSCSNTTLVDYGILNEKSDIRAHVCVKAGKVYVYQTSKGIEAVNKNTFAKAPAYQSGIKTAEGYLVPPDAIDGIIAYELEDERKEKIQQWIKPTDNETTKGRRASKIVEWMLMNGHFPLWTLPNEITDKDLQISGTDIYVKTDARIQVKCDYKGGVGEGCTGNLYLQISECNPFRRH